MTGIGTETNFVSMFNYSFFLLSESFHVFFLFHYVVTALCYAEDMKPAVTENSMLFFHYRLFQILKSTL